LEVGTGSGYQTALLCELGAEVYSIERQKKLFKKTSLFLPKIGYFPKKLIFGDGYIGFDKQAPYDSIIVTAGAPFIPKMLLNQLKTNGKLVIPVGESSQTMTLITKLANDKFKRIEFGEFNFVPLLKDKN